LGCNAPASMKGKVPSAFRIPRAARKQIIATTPDDQLDLFHTAPNRFGTPIGNVEQVIWIWRVPVRYSKNREIGIDA